MTDAKGLREKFEREAAEPSPVMRSWEPLDLDALVAAHGLDRLVADSMFRDDGHALGYKGLTNVLFGQPEAGKSFIMLGGLLVPLIEDAVRTGRGKVVVWVDYEDTWRVFASRLVNDLGVPLADVIAHVHYVAPEGGISGHELTEALDGVITDGTEAVVIDSVNESMVSLGFDPVGMKGVLEWRQQVLKPVQALSSSAAVWVIDHTPMAASSDRRQAFGSQGKLSGVQGAQVRADVKEQPAPGRRGLVKLYVTKDRNGNVRKHAEGSKNSVDFVADAVFAPIHERGVDALSIMLAAPAGALVDKVDLVPIFTATLEAAAQQGEGVTRNQMRQAVKAEGVSMRGEDIDIQYEAFVKANGASYGSKKKGSGVAFYLKGPGIRFGGP